jgi:hypothetical protein
MQDYEFDSSNKPFLLPENCIVSFGMTVYHTFVFGKFMLALNAL